MHTSDQITRARLERIREYCKGRACNTCKISHLCKEIRKHYLQDGIYKISPNNWLNSDITEILKATRNYMEATFIESLEKIVELNGNCGCIKCVNGEKNETENEIQSFIRQIAEGKVMPSTTLIRKAQKLLTYYKGEVE